MLPLLLATTLLTDGPASLTDAQKVDMFCAFVVGVKHGTDSVTENCLLYTSPSPRDKRQSRMPSSA